MKKSIKIFMCFMPIIAGTSTIHVKAATTRTFKSNIVFSEQHIQPQMRLQAQQQAQLQVQQQMQPELNQNQ